MDKNALNIFKKTLGNHNQKVTSVRLYICNLLMNKPPLSMNEIIKMASDRVDRASIYRTIKLFEKIGLVNRLYLGWKYKIELSDILSEHHHHMSCLRCGKVIIIKKESNLEKIIVKITKDNDFKLKHHQIEISGYCANCHN